MSRGVIQDLSRPKAGTENTVTLNTGIRFCKVISRKFICPKCMTFCGELIPILDGRVRDWMRRHKKNLFSSELQVKIFCYAGCHDQSSWGWKEFLWSKKEMDAIRSWPQTWTTDKGALATERVVREEQERMRRGG